MAAKKKATAKRAASKKTSAKKAGAKRSAAKKPAAKKRVSVSDRPPSKSEIMTQIADSTDLSRKQVASVFDALGDMIEANLKPRGPGTFSVPGLVKIVVNKKPATKARKGINPFTGEETVFKAKPARKIVKVRALKSLKDMVA